MQYLILDYYIDEPACFGVPPFISPYVRYSYGAILQANPNAVIDYLTIDELRKNQFTLQKDYQYIFLIAGATVPGRYLGGKIGSLAEIIKFKEINPKVPIILGGPIKFLSNQYKEVLLKKSIILVRGEIHDIAYKIVKNNSLENIDFHFHYKKDYDSVKNFAVLGSQLVKKHFRYPHVIIELETYQGCTRDVFCSFCTEMFYGKPVFRSVEDILLEVEYLYNEGVKSFRLGRQADIYTYMAHLSEYKNTFPKPNPIAIKNLYKGIRYIAKDIEVLHLDNTNPGLIANFPKEAEEITETIVQENTMLDTAAMGMETADLNVIKINDLKANPEEVEFAIQMIHKYGSQLKNNLPKLSVGLNFLTQLPGETLDTYNMNLDFLNKILDKGIFLRRINIRQALEFEKTKLAHLQKYYKSKKKDAIKNKYNFFVDTVRNKIDKSMLKMAFPQGVTIPNVILEKKTVNGFLGRPLGSYPITCNILTSPSYNKNHYCKEEYFGPFKKVDVLITGYKERSLIGIAKDDNVEKLDLNNLKKVFPKKLAYSIWKDGFHQHENQIPSYLNSIVSSS